MLRICRKLAALCFCGGIVISGQWVPSEINPADEPSRVFERQFSAQARDRTSISEQSNGEVCCSAEECESRGSEAAASE
eukprot:5706346-Karenia_brevis.AAC.1